MPTREVPAANVKAIRREEKRRIKMAVHGRSVKSRPARGIVRQARTI